VLVVGGGLAGCLAALAAARERPGAAVEVLVTADDRFDHHPGTIDVLGYPHRATDDGPTADSGPGERAHDETPAAAESGHPVETPLDAIDALPAAHPYRRLGRDRLRAALALFDDALDYCGGDTERNALVPTHVGQVRPTARYPEWMAAGLASRGEPMGLVGFEQSPALDAAFVADRLGERLPYEVTATTVTFPGRVTDAPSGPVLARALDADEAPSGDVGTPDFDMVEEDPPPSLTPDDDPGPARGPLAERVGSELALEGRVGFPAVLGETAHQTVRERLESALYAEVFEIPVGPPSVPGRRLERRLHAALADAGVAVTRGDVDGFDTGDGRIDRVSLSEGDRAVESVVLATGDLAGPGLVADRAGVHERTFDCHVDHPDDRLAWTDARLLGDHAFARFGVSVDDHLRPLDGTGRPEYENLRAAGRIVGGFDYDTEHSADGVALVTGYAAGRWSLS
jgi:glycerol-3-phosphate dehydrogenase subunit B